MWSFPVVVLFIYSSFFPSSWMIWSRWNRKTADRWDTSHLCKINEYAQVVFTQTWQTQTHNTHSKTPEMEESNIQRDSTGLLNIPMRAHFSLGESLRLGFFSSLLFRIKNWQDSSSRNHCPPSSHSLLLLQIRSSSSSSSLATVFSQRKKRSHNKQQQSSFRPSRQKETKYKKSRALDLGRRKFCKNNFLGCLLTASRSDLKCCASSYFFSAPARLAE